MSRLRFFFLSLYHIEIVANTYSCFIFSVSEIAKNKAKLSPGARDALNLVGGDKNVKDLTKM